ncbi:MAG TPA: ATP cone domain-containing protein [Candidatus Limnocylindrales bacterium]|nr:ATP cone domain-containing protein [Candidatus Limnocylindrales bacterium]
MSVENRIVKIQKRNRALDRFDPGRIRRAILRAAESIGGFRQDYLPGINDKLFAAWPTDAELAQFLADAVVVCLNSNPHHFIANFPPTIETIQDEVLHALRSYGFQNTADAYQCYRWGRHWLREGAISQSQFVGNGLPLPQIEACLAWNKIRGCHTITGLNDLTRADKLKTVVRDSLCLYERSLDDAAAQIIDRIQRGDDLRMIWITGPSCAGKTTTTVKLTHRLEQHGLRFLMLNLDDYFWSLVEHPTDWINDRNYETPEAIDIQLLNRHLRELLDGATIQKPTYSFKEGRQKGTKSVTLERNQILLLDCLHGLYPPIADGIPSAAQFRLYIDTLYGAHYADGAEQRLVRSTDVRLLRRMLRDARHRNHGPLLTVLHWHYVRTGELFSIIPLSGLADYTINTGSPFELPALKTMLCGPTSLFPSHEELRKYSGFLDAEIRYQKVFDLLESIEALPEPDLKSYELIPGDAVIREFIGSSTIPIPHNE